MIIPNLDFGGAQRSFVNLANALSASHLVKVCVFNTEKGLSFPLKPEVLDLAIPAGRTWVGKLFNFLRRCYSIRKLKRKLQISTAVSYLEGANYVNVLSQRGERVILSVRGSKYHDQNIRGLLGWIRIRIFMPMIYRRCHHIVALNQGIRRELVEGMGIDETKVSVISNFYDFAAIENQARQPLPVEYQQVFQNDVMLYAGRMAPEKGLKDMLDVFKLLSERHSEVTLVMMGDGPMKSDLIRHAQRSFTTHVQGLDDPQAVSDARVLFLDYQENPYNFLGRATILLITSSHEGGPNILSEAMICRTLVISTDCPYGPREQLAPDCPEPLLTKSYAGACGVLIPVINNENHDRMLVEWSATISRYLQAREARETLAARAAVSIRNQSPPIILEQWEQLI